MQVRQNELTLEMLFQEKAAKEFLELQNRREGPIFEGDESLTWGVEGYEPFELGHLALARLGNQNWAKKGPTSLLISLKAFAKLQTSYISRATISNIDRKLGISIDLPHNTEADERRLAGYEATLISINGEHGLAPHNRKYYWNAFLGASSQYITMGILHLDRLIGGVISVASVTRRSTPKSLMPKPLRKSRADVERVLDDAFAVEFAQAAAFFCVKARQLLRRFRVYSHATSVSCRSF